ncbi:elongation factor P maturation arginine rhamnosyltransferase EarP [Succinivibrio sp.]|uniref:elongation factor P maturation arginine rhamnosyltransferase EarP n=1 Tax=Succinivibrio sp. TaxID=2053619 RepID=UPI00386B7EAF
MIDVFCDVIDNFGDAGVCLRLCRDFSKKNYEVRLFCNNVNILNKITNSEDASNRFLSLLSWSDKNMDYSPSEVVIQAFSVRLPDNLIKKIKTRKSTVINLEYLTAETFAEDCHKLPSYADGFESFFFFPGFTKKTGGVVIEKSFLEKINKTKSKESKNITLFSYENEKVKSVINSLNKEKFILNIFEGKGLNNFNNQLKLNLSAGDEYKLNELTVRVLPMVSQDEYDSYLIDSKLNLVRGEDSIVRAMLTGNPFLWHIYPQEEDVHKDKIDALFDRMSEVCSSKKDVEILRQLTLSYNGFSDYLDSFDLLSFYENWKKLSKEWSEHLISLGSLTDNLITFLKTKTDF